jgi:hypothetical protein
MRAAHVESPNACVVPYRSRDKATKRQDLLEAKKEKKLRGDGDSPSIHFPPTPKKQSGPSWRACSKAEAVRPRQRFCWIIGDERGVFDAAAEFMHSRDLAPPRGIEFWKAADAVQCSAVHRNGRGWGAIDAFHGRATTLLALLWRVWALDGTLERAALRTVV